jgi:hypothetical protein
MAVDTYYNSVSLLLPGDGADGGTTITDAGPDNVTITRTGTGVITATGVKVYGSASLYFPGGSNYLTAPSDAAWTFGTGDFTVEGWMRIDSFGSGIVYLAGTSNGSVNTGEWVVRITSTQVTFAAASSSMVAGLATWASDFKYLAISRVSGTLHIYADGVRLATGAFGGNISAVGTLKIGVEDPGNNKLNGYIDDLRITKGVGRYSGATHDVPSEAHPTSAPITGEADLTFADPYLLTAEGELIIEHGDGEVTFPMPTFVGYGAGIAAVTFPAAVATGYGGGTGAMAFAFPTLYAVGHDTTGEQSFTGTLPSPTLQAYGGASAALQLSALTLDASGTADILGSAALTLPTPTLSATGKVSATGQAQLTLSMASLIGYSGAVGAVTIDGFTVTATGTSGAASGAALTLPLFELTAEASMGIVGRAELLLPALQIGPTAQAWLIAPMGVLTAIGTATVIYDPDGDGQADTDEHEAYSLNLNHKGQKDPVDELTRYTNFPFTHVVRYRNSYFGVAADGLYLLEGTTDYAVTPTEIPWALKTGMSDFGNSAKKTPRAAYFAGRMGPAATITVYEGEKDPTEYSYQTPRETDAQNYRQKFGLGLRARYYAFGIAGEQALALDGIEFDIANLTRRI